MTTRRRLALAPKACRAAGLGLALATAAGPALGAASQPDPPAESAAPGQRELDALQRAIEARRERLRAFEARERGLLETLEQVDRASAELARDVARANAAMREAREKAAAAEKTAREAETRSRAARQAMSVRAVALYKLGDVGPVRALFSAESLRDVVARAQRLRTLLDRDARLLAQWRENEAALTAARAAVRAAAETRAAAQARLTSGIEALDEERATKRALLAGLRADRARERAGLAELEAAARALESKLDDLRATPAAPAPPGHRAIPFAALRGRLDPPIDRRIVRPFGRMVDAEFRTESFRKGIDFEAAVGEAVRAVADGEVRYAGWFRGYGKLVILDHGEQYFTVYGHLDELRVGVGDAVRGGDALGAAGDTGSLAGALLYFEIRRGSDPLDPAEWLAKSRGLD